MIDTKPNPSLHTHSRGSILEQSVLAILSGVGLFLTGFLVIILIYQLIFLGKVFPGVNVAGVDLSGIRRTEAANYLNQNITYANTGSIVIQEDENSWSYTPQELGLIFNSDATAENAYKVGRTGWAWTRLITQFDIIWDNITLAPQFIFDGRICQNTLNLIAHQINQPTIEAYLGINGMVVEVQEGQIGRTVDVNLGVEILETELRKLEDITFNLPMMEFPPIILDVSEQAAIADNILSRPLTLTVSDDPNELGPWVFDQETLASMLSIQLLENETGDLYYQVGLDPNKLRRFLLPLGPTMVQHPQNARFIFNDESRKIEVIQKAVIGRELLIEESIVHINEKLREGAHSIELVYDLEFPEVTDNVTGEEIGVTELVNAQTTYFYGSSSSRIQNIQTAAAQFHGVLVAPGAVFSMSDNIGDISLDSGYAEALIIFGDRTIKGVGGGVCQVSTTLFRTVFFGGYGIEERYSHAYRVYYYELNYNGSVNTKMAGLDATLYTPLVDFKFRNDTPYWLLMETYVNVAARSLTWKFYSTNDGREVNWSTSGLTNVEEAPDPVYEENPDLKKGEVKKVDYAAKGADVFINRTVTLNGNTLHDDEIVTHYRSWAEVWQYGPGTKDYPPKDKSN